MTDILILGAGYAGLRAAKVLAKKKLNANITLINRNDYHYETTALASIAAGTLKTNKVVLPLPATLPAGIHFKQATVTQIDRTNKQVLLADEEPLHYDYLIVALGLVSEDYGVPGAKEYGMPIVSLDTALAVKQHVEKQFQDYQKTQNPDDLNIIVCGAWFSALEYLGALAARLPKLAAHYNIPLNQISVQCIEAKDNILPMFDDQLTNYVKDWLAKHNIILRTGTPIKEVQANAVITDAKTYTANTIIWTTGVSGSPVISASGLENRRNRVMVTDELCLEDDKAVFLIGDVAAVRMPGKPFPYPATGQIAFQMGVCAANNIAADLNHQPRKDFEFNDLGTVLALGDRDGVAKVFGEHKLHGYLASALKRVIDDRSLIEQSGLKTMFAHGRFDFL